MSIDLLNQLYDKMSVYGDTYGNTQEDINTNQENSDSTGIAPILLPPIASIGSGEGGEENINRNIDYNNLIIPSLESKQKSNIFTDAINRFKSFGDKNKLAGGILKAGSFLKDPAMALFTSAMGMLPKEDPMATATRNFYGKNFGLKSDNRIASGIMENYNPVYGSDLLNKISQGIIPESGYGLTNAIDKRIAKINETLKKYDKYKYGSKAFDQDKYNQQIEKIKKLEAIKQKEALALKEAQEKVKEKEYQDRIAREADTAARARAANAAVYESADRQGFTNDRGGFSTSAADRAGTSAGSGQFSSESGRGRTGYGKGGIVTL